MVNVDQISATDQNDLLAQVWRFAEQRIAPLVQQPEEPISAERLADVTRQAAALGLLDPEPDQVALWTSAPGIVEFSAAALRVLAGVDAGVAVHLHRLALTNRLQQRLGLADPGPGSLSLLGHWGLGRGALPRLLSGKPLSDADRMLLLDYFDLTGRPRIVLGVPDRVLAAAFDGGGITWHDVRADNCEVVIQPHPHGLDAVPYFTLRLRDDVTPVSRDTAPYGEALFLDSLGLLAITAGAVDHALARAGDYAATRRQGGTLIKDHPAVQQMLARLVAARTQAAQAIAASAVLRPAGESLPDLAASLTQLGPLCCDAVNQAMQVFGGMGYLRDVGVERLVRDANCLRVLTGTPGDLEGFVANWRESRSAADDARSHQLLSPGHPLSPRTAFGSLRPLGRRFVSYSPATVWEQDTRRLPPTLARLRREIRTFAEQRLRPIALEIDVRPSAPRGGWDPRVKEVFVEAGRRGYLTDLLPAPLGTGALRDVRHIAWRHSIKTEELARVCGGLMLLLSAPALGMAPIVLSGDLQAVRRFLLPAFRQIRRGEPHPFAFAITEPDAGSDVEDGHGAATCRPGVVARPARAGGWLLSGRKVFISGGDIARTITVFAALEGEGMESWTCFAVPVETPGFRVVRTELKMGMRASGAAELEFNDVHLPATHVVGGLRSGWALSRVVLNFSRIPVAGMAVGFAQSALDVALEFAASTRLSGKSLVDYQEVQLALAQMMAETAAIRALVWQSAATFTPRQAPASIAKFHCTDRAVAVCNLAMDLLGNHSLLHANRVEKVFRDARLTQIFEGTNQINRLAVIEDLQDEIQARFRS